MIPPSHHGTWQGPNRLWMEGATPERSEGQVEVAETAVRYTWTFRGDAQEGRLALFGPPGAVRADWVDTFHAADGMALHGRLDDGVLVLYTTYGAGDGPEWGWRVELDVRDPEHFTLAMFNLDPDGKVHPAVYLRGTR